MKTIRLKWGVMGDGQAMVPDGCLELNLLQRYHRVELVDVNPEYLFCDVQAFDDLDYKNCVKIVRTIENNVPDFNRYDYAMGFDYITIGDRYLRVPLWTEYACYEKLKERTMPKPEELLKRKFCSFVVSNNLNVDPIREYFFKELSKYKQVDSGGRLYNNVGGPVADKLEFCKNYKFNIAFENSAVPGYTTEKIMEPLAVHSVPIYYGDPLVNNDFTPECMVCVKGMEDVKRAIEEVIALDKDDDAYLAKCYANPLVHEWDYYQKQREQFIINIFSQPFEKARRTVDYGFQENMRQRLARMNRLDNKMRLVYRIVHKIKRLLRLK